MDAEPQPEDPRPRRSLARAGPWCAAAGLVLAAALVACLAAGAISTRQSIGLAIPCIVLIAGGLTIAALPDPATAWRQGFQAGLRAGSLLRLWRSIFRR